MPKSRHRKNRKPYRARRAPKAAAQAPAGAPSKPSLRRLLLENDGELMFQLATFLPLVAGTWLAGGAALARPGLFMVLVGVTACAHYLQLVFAGRLPLFDTKSRVLLLHLAGGVLIAVFCVVSQSLAASLLLIAWWVLTLASAQLRLETPRALILLLLALIARVSVIGVLGAASQFPELLIPLATLGFVPATYLAASLTAKHAHVLEEAGWRRSFEHTAKFGKNRLRPGGVTQLFAFLLVAGPVVVMSCFPFGLLPETLLICALPLYFMPGAASAFSRAAAAGQRNCADVH